MDRKSVKGKKKKKKKRLSKYNRGDNLDCLPLKPLD